MRRPLISFALLVFFISSYSTPAQNNYPAPGGTSNDTSAPVPGAGHDYIHLLSETVNPSNGTVSINIGLPTPKGRGLSLPFAITYNSGAAGHWIGNNTAFSTSFAIGGWGNTLPTLQFSTQSLTFPHGDGEPGSPTETCYFTTNYSFADLSGQSHALGLAAASLQPFTGGDCTEMGSNIASFAVRNTGGDSQVSAEFTELCGQPGTNGPPPSTGCDYAEPPVVAFDGAGNVYSFAAYGQNIAGPSGSYEKYPTSVEDRNGNILSFAFNGSTHALVVTDTAGRQVVNLNSTLPTVVSVGGLTYNIAYTTATASYTGVFNTLPPPNGSTNPPGTNCNQYLPQPTSTFVVHTITLPNHQVYTFQYNDAYGLVSEIDYPDGGWVKYSWKLSDDYSDNDLYSGIVTNAPPLNSACNFQYKTPVVGTRTVGFTSSPNPNLTQVFTYHTNWNTSTGLNWSWLSKTTTVATTDNVTGKSQNTNYTYSDVSAGPPCCPGFNGSATVAGQIAVEQEVDTYDWGQTTSPMKKTIKHWFDQFELQDVTTGLALAQGSTQFKESEISYTYGSLGAMATKVETGYSLNTPGSALRQTANQFQTFGPNPLYKVDTTAKPTLYTLPCKTTISDGNGTLVAETDILYDSGTSLCGSLGGGAGTTAPLSGAIDHDDTNFAPNSSTPRGNATTVTRKCVSGCSTSPVTTYTYLSTGQVATMVDPCGNSSCPDVTGSDHTTTYTYTDSYTSGTPPGNTNAYLTNLKRPVTSGTNHVSSYSYDWLSGQITVSTDENSQSTTYSYSGDLLERLTSVTPPPSAAGETTYTYVDGTSPSVTSQGVFVKSVSKRDGMGHVTQTQTSYGSNSPAITDISYDGMGHQLTVSNPYFTGDPTYVTTYTYDGLGRVTLKKNTDASTASTIYGGAAVETADEGNGTRSVQRISQYDGLGRLKSVCEVSGNNLPNGTSANFAQCGEDIAANGFPTSYTYDTLDDLQTVVQGSLASRQLSYDSLRRPISVSNPESNTASSGTMVSTTYVYDVNGNVATRTAPLQNQQGSALLTTTYSYDALNRLGAKTYSDSTPKVQFGYDSSSITMGTSHLTTTNTVSRPSWTCVLNSSQSACTSMEAFGYDAVGRLTDDYQCVPLNCATSGFHLNYTYDLAGNRLAFSDGVGVTLTDTYPQGQLTGLNSSLSDANHPASMLSAVVHNATGAESSATLGNGLTETVNYSLRAWPTSFVLSGSTYSYAVGYAPNGDVLSTTDSVNHSWTYAYDDFNRLIKATEASPSNVYTYDYDRYGNRWHQYLGGACTAGTTFCLTFDTNNRVSSGALVYDTAGNVTQDSQHHYYFDAENRMTQIDGTVGACATATACYVYDAGGRRVQKIVAGASLYFLYDDAGHPSIEITPSGTWDRIEVYASGRHLATYGTNGNKTDFNHSDWLGTVRARTNVGAVVCETTTSLPFGDGQTTSQGCGAASPIHFTGKERDSESGLDNFGARYNSSIVGRFMSPDQLGAGQHPGNPQSWNLYDYATNNPVTLTDPLGEFTCDSKSVSTSECDNVQKALDVAQTAADALGEKYGWDSKIYNDAQRAIDAYGDEDVDNGVHISQGAAGSDGGAVGVSNAAGPKTDLNKNGQNIQVVFDKASGLLDGDSNTLAALAVHEGVHVADASDWVTSGFSDNALPSVMQTEHDAYNVEAAISSTFYPSNTTPSVTYDFGQRSYFFLAPLTPHGEGYTDQMIRNQYPNYNFDAFKDNKK